MLTKIFTIYDSKTQAYMSPFFNTSTGGALRSFEEACRDENSTFHKYPSDFTLFEIGTFDDNNAKISFHDSKISLGCAIEYAQSNQKLEAVK